MNPILANHRRSRAAWTSALLGTIAAMLGAQEPAPTPPGPARADPVVQRLVEAHNQERAREKLPPLKLEARLEEAARAHARDMADRQVMSHDGGDGSTPTQRIVRAGYHFLRTGENVAAGYRDVPAVIQGWMDSPPHRKNVLGEFTEIGVARVEGKDGKLYWCADFAKPMPRLDPAVAGSDLLKRINAERAATKLPALAVDDRLARAAASAATGLAKAKGKGGTPSAFDGLDQKSYRELAMTTSVGQPDADALVKGLMENPDYKARLLGNYARAGLGYATDDDGIPYWCVILALPAGR